MSRGTVIVQTDRCKGCSLCVGACPQAVLHLSADFNARGYHAVQLDEREGSCTGCGVCAIICPDVVFTVYRSPTEASRRKERTQLNNKALATLSPVQVRA